MANGMLINAEDFIRTLEQRGLVIVSAKEFEASKEIHRRRLMKRRAISIKDIVDHNLLPLKSKRGVESWIENGKIKPSEVIREQSGKKKILVLTSAIKRLGYGE